MKKILIVIFLIPLMSLSASTIIINSIYDKDINPDALRAAAAIEDGLMESLFDFGFIMFSTVNSKEYRVDGAKDARYMITIEPLTAENSVFYKLQATVNGMVIDSGVLDSTHISSAADPGTGKFYYLLGEELAAELLEFF